MKKRVPLVLGMIAGFIALFEYYVDHWAMEAVSDELLTWAQVLLAAAFVLGGINIIQVNWPKIRRREPDWGYKVLLLASAAGMFLVGSPEIFDKPTDADMMRVEVVSGDNPNARPVIRIETTRPEALISVGSESKTGSGEFVVEPGTHKVGAAMELYGYGSVQQDVKVGPGQIAVVRTDLPMLWGKEGRAYKWMYNYIFDPCNSTMFALLAFFIASAAFRAFRARNVEAALLLGSAIIIMLGRAPIGSWISGFLPAVSDWIVDVGNNSGRRAIMMGAALGAIATGLRVILGLERSHLGSD